MAPQRTNHGKGAKVFCLIKFLHPLELIRKAYPNPLNQQWLENFITLCQDVKKIKQKRAAFPHHNPQQLAEDEKTKLMLNTPFKELYNLYRYIQHFILKSEFDYDDDEFDDPPLMIHLMRVIGYFKQEENT